jgi:hypothetical protein
LNIVSNVNLTRVIFPLLTSLGGMLSFSDNAALTHINMTALSRVDGGFIFVTAPSLTRVDFPDLRFVGIEMTFQSTTATHVSLPSLTHVGNAMTFLLNSALTSVHLPKLTFLGFTITFCQNHASFVIPSGLPDAPTGGLVVTGPFNGRSFCYLKQGASPCSTTDACP